MNRAWPFLISRNRKLGYHTVVAPNFPVDRKLCKLLEDKAGGARTIAGQAYCRELHNTKFGTLTIVYRVIQAVDISNGQPLLDDFTRQVDRIEGFVLDGDASDLHIADSDLDKVHNRVDQNFRDFWLQTDPVPPAPHDYFPLTNTGQDLKQALLNHQEPYNAGDIQEVWLRSLTDSVIVDTLPTSSSGNSIGGQSPSPHLPRPLPILEIIINILLSLSRKLSDLLQKLFGQR